MHIYDCLDYFNIHYSRPSIYFICSVLMCLVIVVLSYALFYLKRKYVCSLSLKFYSIKVVTYSRKIALLTLFVNGSTFEFKVINIV